MDIEYIKVENAYTKNINKLETKTLVIKEPLTKEYFRDVFNLPRIGINFSCNEDNNQQIATMDCDVQWGACKGKNPYRYSQGFDLEMKACIEYLWPIVHQHKMPSTTISLVFEKGILVEHKKLEVDFASHIAFTNKLQTNHVLVQKDFCPPPHVKAL
jgi:hypothetical protein